MESGLYRELEYVIHILAINYWLNTSLSFLSLQQNMILHHYLLGIIMLHHLHKHCYFKIIKVHTKDCKNIKGDAHFPHAVQAQALFCVCVYACVRVCMCVHSAECVKSSTGYSSGCSNGCEKGSCRLLG